MGTGVASQPDDSHPQRIHLQSLLKGAGTVHRPWWHGFPLLLIPSSVSTCRVMLARAFAISFIAEPLLLSRFFGELPTEVCILSVENSGQQQQCVHSSADSD